MHHPRPTRALLLLVGVLVGALGLGVSPALAAAPTATTASLAAPTGKAGLTARFAVTLRDGSQAGVPGRALALQRLTSTWSTVATATTGSDGTASVPLTLPAGDTTWRVVWRGDATYAGSTSTTATATGRVLSTTLTLDGPGSVVDERSLTLAGRWLASDGSAIAGRTVVLERRGADGSWAAYRTLRTSSTGRWSASITPRSDASFRASGSAGSWWRSAASSVHAVDNRPAGTPVALPSAAPRPAPLAAQSRASGAGANAVITRLPDAVWNNMVGRSWHRGCPVGRSGLRLLRINYWGFDGYRYRGEMVLATAVTGRAAAALKDMYAQKLPVRRMYRVDRFGWSSRVRGADDHASMRADNTSAFNCRWVVNKPGVMSPHARGRAIDLNTWENPYRSATGWVPNTWWSTRSHPRVAWRSASHPVVKIWRAHGFRWTYGTGDSQHVDGRTAPGAVAGTFTG
ncbi:M15 family metallopeptidase [Nocardioides aurantiacus]|uniref:D-alanyl-D-alanine carboxypeptidase-like protein n=1 Tax=Nocardioides aurantiacus TaxID=86796 RepID=A0A3N2CS55_9ACTN|nr:M15 family metallopeptidase [Nocardioides aurantiacus]ROR90372.1 D-alanyl-D-alanine carboxypeptidase-like protein [Nocardioides aurantiacus]